MAESLNDMKNSLQELELKTASGDQGSVETERTIQRASEFCKPQFSSEPSEFRACLNLITIPYS